MFIDGEGSCSGEGEEKKEGSCTGGSCDGSDKAQLLARSRAFYLGDFKTKVTLF